MIMQWFNIFLFPMKAFTDFVVLLASTAVDGAVSHESIYWFHGSSSIGCSRWCALSWKHLLISWFFQHRLQPMVWSSMKAFGGFHSSSSIDRSRWWTLMKAFTDFMVLPASARRWWSLLWKNEFCTRFFMALQWKPASWALGEFKELFWKSCKNHVMGVIKLFSFLRSLIV